jgi:hypothetical protein
MGWRPNRYLVSYVQIFFEKRLKITAIVSAGKENRTVCLLDTESI